MLPPDLDVADALVREFRVAEAWPILESIVADNSLSPEIRSDAYQLLGCIVEIDPSYGDGDECGLSFYRQAVELVPNHLWANYAIVSNYGDAIPQHQDRSAFMKALKALNGRESELLPQDVEIIERQSAKYCAADWANLKDENDEKVA